ncbi:Acyl-CoA:1-acyl-sn-glycerol-3-phosphate acyltransferase [hydrothermal vent metagenome]|uniref:Acyl-CoA:1-acyl-sn-glycerol-3-phosphate acyltransferase n=1 Tax=hydrothermal vent metagenome TaxID=652676 RepID=A0A3B0XLP6_9ZZZZ
MKEQRKYSKAELYMRSTVFWLFHFVSMVLVVSTVLVFFWLPVNQRYAIGSSWAKMNMFFLRWFCGLSYEIKGRENIPKQASLVISNHQSTWETLSFQHFLPNQLWVMKKELFHIPIFGWGLALMSPIAIDRSAGKKAVDQIVEQGEEKLTQGRWVIVFPEGTRISPGVESKYKMGAFIFASRISHPVLPVAHNAGEFWPKHSFIKYPGVITVSIGEAFDASAMKPDEVKQKVEGWIRQELSEISNPDRRGGLSSR